MYIPRRHASLITGDSSQDDAADIDKNLLKDIQQEQEAAVFLRRDSNCDRIMEAAKQYMYDATKFVISEAASCIDRDILLAIAKEKKKANIGMLSMPFSIAFFLLFATAAFTHEDVSTVYAIENGLRNILGRDVAEISSPEKAYQWLNKTLLPEFFKQTDVRGKAITDKTEWGRVLTYNHLVGPVVLEQERSSKELCSKDGSGIAKDMMCYYETSTNISEYGDDIGSNFTAPYDGEHTGGNVTMDERVDFFKRPFKVFDPSDSVSGRRLRVTRPEYQARLAGTALTASGKGNSFRAEFFANERYELMQQRFNYLYQRGWIDRQTKYLSSRAMLINAEVGRPRLESYTLILSFSRSGEVFAKLVVDTLFLEFWPNGISQLSDAVWIMMLMGVSLSELKNLCGAARIGKCCATMKTPWFILQWSLVCCGWGIVMGYAFINFLMIGVKADLLDVRDMVVKDTPPEHNSLGIELMDSAAFTSWFYMWLRLAVAQYHLLLMMRFFVSFRCQPRLGIVITTLEVCLLDILHFLVILIPVYAAYAISGCFIFGRRIEEFSTLQSSMGMCFKYLMESEFDWPSLSEEHYWTSAMWTWSFMVFVGMLMLNMVLAIVLDAYAEQRKLGGKRESIFGTAYNLLIVFRYWRTWIGTDKLEEKFNSMPRFVSREEFLKEFPGMPSAQADLLLKRAQEMAAAINVGPEHWKNTLRMAMALVVSMDRITEDMDELSSGTYVPDPDDVSMKCNAATWLSEISQEMAAQSHSMLALQWRLQQLKWASQALEMAHGKEATFDLSEGWFGVGKDGKKDSDNTI